MCTCPGAHACQRSSNVLQPHSNVSPPPLDIEPELRGDGVTVKGGMARVIDVLLAPLGERRWSELAGLHVYCSIQIGGSG